MEPMVRLGAPDKVVVEVGDVTTDPSLVVVVVVELVVAVVQEGGAERVVAEVLHSSACRVTSR